MTGHEILQLVGFSALTFAVFIGGFTIGRWWESCKKCERCGNAAAAQETL